MPEHPEYNTFDPDTRGFPEPAHPAPVFLPISDYTREETDWLWDDRIPFGGITVVDGLPGSKKTWMMIDIAARLSRGDSMPGGFGKPDAAKTLLISYEDDPARTLRPRYEDAAGVMTPDSLHVLDHHDHCSLHKRDMDIVEDYIQQYGIRLVIIDPIASSLPGGRSMNSDQDMRECLTPIKILALKSRAAFVFIRHLNKGQGQSVTRGAGTIGISGAARSVLLCAQTDEDNSVVASVKNNLGPRPGSIRYHVESKPAQEWGMSFRLRYDQITGHTAEDLLRPPKKKVDSPGKPVAGSKHDDDIPF